MARLIRRIRCLLELHSYRVHPRFHVGEHIITERICRWCGECPTWDR